jgi:uncharacterized membrane protein
MGRFIKPDILFYIFLILLGIGGLIFSIIWPQTEGFYATMIAAALAGLGVTIYIFYAKHFRKHLACPTGSDCNVVVNSKYSHFLGISLEYLGALYYSAVITSYALLLIYPHLREGVLMTTILILTAIAFLFSLYLLFVQGFILRKWCIWCLLSATLSILIFIASLISIEGVGTILLGMENYLMLFRDFGFALGIGGSTASLLIFFKFLDDFIINDNEANSLKRLSEMVWLGLGFTLFAKLAYFVSMPEAFTESNTLIVQMSILFVIFVSGAVLNVIYAPFITALPFHHNGDESTNKHASLASLKKGTYIAGAIGIVSWYFAFVLDYLPEHELANILTAYGIVLLASVIVSLVLNRHFR